MSNTQREHLNNQIKNLKTVLANIKDKSLLEVRDFNYILEKTAPGTRGQEFVSTPTYGLEVVDWGTDILGSPNIVINDRLTLDIDVRRMRKILRRLIRV